MLARIRKALEEKDEKGFTLIELLVVIIIIGILAAIAIPIFLNQKKKAVDASIKSDLHQVANEEESYFTDNTEYTSTAANLHVKYSGDNKVSVVLTTNKDAYCLKGSSTKGTADGSATGGFFWYDSANGGLSSTPGTSAPTGFATCTGTFTNLN